MTLLNLRHWWRKRHWPEWYETHGLMACLRCARGGTRVRILRFGAVPLPLR